MPITLQGPFGSRSGASPTRGCGTSPCEAHAEVSIHPKKGEESEGKQLASRFLEQKQQLLLPPSARIDSALSGGGASPFCRAPSQASSRTRSLSVSPPLKRHPRRAERRLRALGEGGQVRQQQQQRSRACVAAAAAAAGRVSVEREGGRSRHRPTHRSFLRLSHPELLDTIATQDVIF
ncbi:hypothetical protein Esti_004933 [Eimeria stiedai]